eukprot:5330357-Lingulodinium_polyedra.AAC.1
MATRGGPAAVARLLEAHWRKLWQRPVAGPMSEEWARAWDGLPRFRRRTEWPPARIRAILANMGTRKMPGPDG